jgi:hypothetical protein
MHVPTELKNTTSVLFTEYFSSLMCLANSRLTLVGISSIMYVSIVRPIFYPNSSLSAWKHISQARYKTSQPPL